MFKEQNNLFSTLLRIITIEEINEFVRGSGGGKRQHLTDLMFETSEEIESLEEEGKVLEFEKKDEVNYRINENDVYSREIIKKKHTSNKLKHLTNIEVEEEDEFIEKVNIASFILYEKQKLETINKVVKKRELIKLYQENSAVDLEQEKQFRDDLSKSSKLGILLNKRQS